METTHYIYFKDSRNMGDIPDESVDLVITSPPYPLIEMWDELFNNLLKLKSMNIEDIHYAYEWIHKELDKTWVECYRILKQGGIICINIGDAVRTIDSFRLYPNHTRVSQKLQTLPLIPLPSIIWQKPNNSPNKFMGSGMLPPNAYVTLEHEHILIFRKGNRRKIKPKDKNRYNSSYFWEERNKWFSNIWTNLQGEIQNIDNYDKRTGAFPLELPYRLINMFSLYGDTIVDPFLGTATTTIASMISGRNSIGYEINNKLEKPTFNRIKHILTISRKVLSKRLYNHIKIQNTEVQSVYRYQSSHYNFNVMTEREKEILFYVIKELIIHNSTKGSNVNRYLVKYKEFNPEIDECYNYKIMELI